MHIRWMFLLLTLNNIVACGGNNDSAEPIAPVDTSAQNITNVQVTHITAHSAVLTFNTAQPASPRVSLIAAQGREQFDAEEFELTHKTEHQLNLNELWSDTQWSLTLTVDDLNQQIQFTTTEPDWAVPCRSGALSVPVSTEFGWQPYTDKNGHLSVSSVSGCNGQDPATQFQFDLNDGEWIVAAQQTPFESAINLTPYTHLWVPVKGTEGVPVALEIKLKDSSGTLAQVRLDGGSGLPVWRDWAIDLRQFSAFTGSLDLANIISLEFGFSWPMNAYGQRKGSVTIGQIQAWNLNEQVTDIPNTEPVIRDTAAMAEIAADLLSQQRQHGFLPAWRELEPNWHLYANAMALIVFSFEYERLLAANNTNAIDYVNAANAVADQLIRLQALSDRNGAWDDSFAVVNNALTLKPASQRVMWVGSTAWAGLALTTARNILPEGNRFDAAISAASNYFTTHQDCRIRAGLPNGSITEGTEGNISSHLFLQSADNLELGDGHTTQQLGQFINEHLFDPQQRRFFCGVSVDIGSSFNINSCTISGSGMITKPDAQACLDVIGNWGTQWLLTQDQSSDAARGLAISRILFPTSDFAGKGIKGLGDIAGPWTPTVEHGAGQYAAQQGADSNFLINQALQHLCTDGQCRGAADDFSAGIGWNTTAHGVAPAAWMYLALHGNFWPTILNNQE